MTASKDSVNQPFFRKGGSTPPDPSYDPVTALGANLLHFWDAETPSSITQTGGNVSQWRDRIANIAMSQAVSGLQPTYSTAEINNRAGVTFDGLDDNLEASNPALPLGSTSREIWILASNAALTGNLNSVFAYGTSNSNRIVSISLTPSNYFTSAVGLGGASVIEPTTSDIWAYAGVARLVLNNGQATLSSNNRSSNTIAGTPATQATTARIGARSFTLPSRYWRGTISAIMITSPLSTTDRNNLMSYLLARGGVV